MLVYSTFESPVGRGVVAMRDGRLVSLKISSSTPPAGAVEDRAALRPFLEKLARFFAGERVDFDERLDVDVTPFARRVLQAARRIPWGETRTYGEIARAAGSPGGARAVGQVMGANPVSIVVPCHRVVASEGIGGFTGGLHRKRALLAIESKFDIEHRTSYIDAPERARLGAILVG